MRFTLLGRRLALVLLFSSFPAAALFAGDCEPDTPARPVPQFDPDLAPGVSLWPLDPVTGDIRFQPAGLPESIERDDLDSLPINRDSTLFSTQSVPGEFSGHELFMDVAAAGSRVQGAPASDWLVVVYNAGVEVWNVAGNPAHPLLVEQMDGWLPPSGPGDWAVFPPGGEEDIFVLGVDVVEDADRLVIGVASRASVGFAVWVFDKLSLTLSQVYQDPLNIDGEDVSLVEDPNGKIYAFVTSRGVSGDDGGLYVYDLTTAAAGSLCVDPEGMHTCGVFRGEMGNLPKVQHVSALVAGGETYVAVADGVLSNNPLDFELWEVSDPENPNTSTLKFSGLGDRVSSPQLFSYNGAHYLALLEDVGGGPNPEQMRVHDVTACLDADGCLTLGPALATETIDNSFPNVHFLDVSFSGGAPFLHYGMETTGLFGNGFERLWQLESLPTPTPADSLPELTDGGGTYTDPCNGEQVGYFGDYFTGNEFGLRQFNPRHAIFNGEYLYRAGKSILDIHHLRELPGVIFADGFESGDVSRWPSASP